ncbi:MAG: LysR family transcriptional regulator [Clostridiales bacterium]|nr:LysR family transcriptional regulator [Clostridiales bacterium]
MIDNLSLYKIFLEVAKSGSISGAARRLYVTQPAVSSGVSQLEAALGTKLFFRTSRGISLTPEGDLLFEYISSALTYIEAGEDKLRDISGLASGVLRVGASDMTLKYFLLDYIERFNAEYPKIKLSVTNNPTPVTLKALRSGLIDFCVISEPAELDTDVESVPVKVINDIVVCSRDARFDPLFQSDTADMRDLAGYPLIMLDRGTSTRQYIESHLRAFGMPDSMLDPSIELAQSDLILQFALRGLGAAFIVRDFAEPYLASGELREVKLSTPIPPRRFLLTKLKKIPLSAASKKFVAAIMEDVKRQSDDTVLQD